MKEYLQQKTKRKDVNSPLLKQSQGLFLELEIILILFIKINSQESLPFLPQKNNDQRTEDLPSQSWKVCYKYTVLKVWSWNKTKQKNNPEMNTDKYGIIKFSSKRMKKNSQSESSQKNSEN